MNEISSSERCWAAVGHWAAVLGLLPFPFINVVGPLLVFLMERDESKHAAFHARQSLILQAAIEVIVWPGLIIFLLVMSLIGKVFGFSPSLWVTYLVVSLFYVLRLVAVLYALLAGIKVYQGSEFEYIIVGQFARGR